tara:strand:- start:3872 stop:4213 length:342 start_codon:yes stop_codon:yes gene_type:complete
MVRKETLNSNLQQRVEKKENVLRKLLEGESTCCDKDCLFNLDEGRKKACKEMLQEINRKGRQNLEFMLRVVLLSAIMMQMSSGGTKGKRRRYKLTIFGKKVCREAFLKCTGYP